MLCETESLNVGEQTSRDAASVCSTSETTQYAEKRLVYTGHHLARVEYIR